MKPDLLAALIMAYVIILFLYSKWLGNAHYEVFVEMYGEDANYRKNVTIFFRERWLLVCGVASSIAVLLVPESFLNERVATLSGDFFIIMVTLFVIPCLNTIVYGTATYATTRRQRVKFFDRPAK